MVVHTLITVTTITDIDIITITRTQRKETLLELGIVFHACYPSPCHDFKANLGLQSEMSQKSERKKVTV